MFTDPQSVTISGTTSSLPRTGNGQNSAVYTSNDGNIKETVSHINGKRYRRMFRLDTQKVAPDPLISSANIIHKMGVYLVVDTPVTGYTVAEQKAVVDALIAQLSASSGALLTKFLGGES